jgi:hypothetical protein
LIAALVIGGVLLLAMVAAAGYAIRTLPADARVPLHAGTPEYSVWLSKRAGLAVWLGIGMAAFAVFAALTVSGIASNWSQSVRAVLLPSVMSVALAAEAAAIISAQRRGPASQVPPESAAPESAAPETAAPESAAPETGTAESAAVGGTTENQ